MISRTIDMQEMRYLNLFEKITTVSTRFCFKYNESIVFCVPMNMISRAVGENGRNAKKISEVLGRKIKIISVPKGIENAKKFVQDIVSPVRFRNLEVKNNEIILPAGSHSKAALIGRNKRRLIELQKISKDYFGKELKIV